MLGEGVPDCKVRFARVTLTFFLDVLQQGFPTWGKGCQGGRRFLNSWIKISNICNKKGNFGKNMSFENIGHVFLIWYAVLLRRNIYNFRFRGTEQVKGWEPLFYNILLNRRSVELTFCWIDVLLNRRSVESTFCWIDVLFRRSASLFGLDVLLWRSVTTTCHKALFRPYDTTFC